MHIVAEMHACTCARVFERAFLCKAGDCCYRTCPMSVLNLPSHTLTNLQTGALARRARSQPGARSRGRAHLPMGPAQPGSACLMALTALLRATPQDTAGKGSAKVTSLTTLAAGLACAPANLPPLPAL